MSVSESDILTAMSKVMDPELHVDLVKAGMVKDVRVAGDSVKLKIELTTPACPMKGKIQADAEAALKAVPGLKSFDIEWGAQVRSVAGGSGNAMLPKVKNIILVGAGKGGVGKSTVAVNLATALAQHGAKVGLLDADFYGPSVPLMTGLSDKRPVSPDGKSLEPLTAHGLKVMSIGFLVEADQALIWRGPMLHGALMQLVRDVNWGDLDYLVLDLPPGTGDVALSLSQSVRAAGAVLVTTPQDVALADVVRAKQMFDKVHIPVLGIVENMSQFVCPHCSHTTAIFNHGGGRKAAEMFGIPFLGEIPLDLKVRESGDSGTPVVVAAKDSLEAKAFQEVARNIAGRVSAQTMKGIPLPVVQAR
ncbi:iron-sulfur cluster carrier protein ApbC [Corallococcus sp. M34]|uniref:iron-sulfur cluster carrier protein ApbC n=1 Tax=Citreicoccus inhibens TaxID=2849499 RepID=UPI001C248FF6|nr:iron-sulfur cluster carrier protein ApbC [Citreicoccus inhibens]MBU8894721.1 iron-sulfur cluster carrier protein ApbC [Citreicoccus inhibens]